jgi:predicted RNA-binding Zn ribbon-like protein
LCLDFTNTVSARGSDAARDRLKTYADLAAWGEEAGALDGEAAAALLQEAAMDAASAERVLERAVALREALYRIFVAQAEGLTPSACDVDRLNAELKQAAARRRLEAGPAQYVWDWEPGGRALDQALWRVAASAADLLTSGELDRVRRCAGDECGWLFIDRSKNRSRRWCDMKECGNVAKVRRYRRRQKVEQS